MAIVSWLGPSYQIIAKQTWISLTKCCEKFREMVYNFSHFMQQMLPQVDGLKYPIQHRSTKSMKFLIQCRLNFLLQLNYTTPVKFWSQTFLSKMGLCGHSFHVSKRFYPIFSLKFHISVLNAAVIWPAITKSMWYWFDSTGWEGGGGWGSGRRRPEQSVDYQLKDFFRFC